MAQLAYAPVALAPAPVAQPIVGYYDAVRDIANEALNGEDTDARVAALASAFGVSVASVDQEVSDYIDLIKEL